MTRAAAVVLALVALALPARADPITDACPEAPCAAVEDGLRRPGVSYDDLTGDDVAAVAIDDFYFAPRAAVIRDGQTVVFTNRRPVGGNRHSVSSADWGGPEPVLPVPVLSFGGGEAFRSARLQPGTAFTMTVDVAQIDPRAYVPLPNGDVLISYFCYIHGASQMNGQLIVRR